MAKRYDLDVGKKRARKKLREFIKKNVFNRKRANVLCFPGEYGTEIEDVYRKLGFRDCNIWGVERDKKAAKAIQERYPEIYVYQGDVSDFVRSYDGPPFDVVSLDFCGHATADKLTPVVYLSLLGHLSDRCVVHFNVMAGRERKDDQDALRSCYARVILDRRKVHGKWFQAVDGGFADIQSILDKASDEELAQVREDAITHALLAQPAYLVPAMKVCGKYDLNEYRGSLVHLKASSKIGTKIIDNEDGSGYMMVENAELGGDHLTTRATAIKNQAIHDINAMLKRAKVTDYLKEDARRRYLPYNPDFDVEALDYHFGRGLVMFFFDKHGESHVPTALERYSYISESGRRMVTDLDKIPDPIFPGDPEEGEGGDHRFYLHWPEIYSNGAEGYHKWMQWLARIHSKYARVSARYCKSRPDSWPDREDLGGGAAIMTEEKVKERVIGYIKQGKNNEYILRKFPTFKKGTLAAIRAHVTMGTY